MQFSTFALAAFSIGSALAQSSDQVKVHVVTVGSSNGSLTYSPNNLVAAQGEMVQFQFMPANHTVTQSNFDNPCEPISLHSNVTGIFSGFMPVAKDATSMPTFTVLINDTKPIWIYCSQGKHCQSGMSLVVNENTTANASRSLANYQLAAKNVLKSLAPGVPGTDGTSGSTTPSAAPPSGTGSGSGTGTGSSPSSTSSSSIVKNPNAAAGFKAPAVFSMGALLAVGFVVFL